MGLTAYIIIAFTIGIAVYDSWAYVKNGPEATISRVLYTASQRWPVIAFAFGFLMAHLFWTNGC